MGDGNFPKERRWSQLHICRCRGRVFCGDCGLAMCLAVPGRVLEIAGEDSYFRTARVSFGGVIKQVNLACVPEARVDDYVLVHAGVALNVVDEREAAAVFGYLREIGEIEERAAPPADAPR